MNLTRRQFLAQAATASLASCTSLPFGKGGSIDAHVHVWTPDTQAYPLATGFTKEGMKPPSFTPEQLFSHCRPEGVDPRRIVDRLPRGVLPRRRREEELAVLLPPDEEPAGPPEAARHHRPGARFPAIAVADVLPRAVDPHRALSRIRGHELDRRGPRRGRHLDVVRLVDLGPLWMRKCRPAGT